MFMLAGLSSALAAFGLYAFQATAPVSMPLNDTFAVRVLPRDDREKVRDDTARLLQKELKIQLLANRVGDRVGLIIFKMPPGTNNRMFSTRLSKWLSKHERLVASPVVASPAGYNVPTGKIIVEFAENVSPEDSRATLAKFGVKIIEEPTSFRPTRFVVENESGANPILLAQRIAAMPKVRFAEPDLLQVFPSRVQKLEK